MRRKAMPELSRRMFLSVMGSIIAVPEEILLLPSKPELVKLVSQEPLPKERLCVIPWGLRALDQFREIVVNFHRDYNIVEVSENSESRETTLKLALRKTLSDDQNGRVHKFLFRIESTGRVQSLGYARDDAWLGVHSLPS